MDVILLEAQLDLLRLPLLVVAVEAVVFDEGSCRHESPVGWGLIVSEAVTLNQLICGGKSCRRPASSPPCWGQSAGRPLRQGPKGRRGGKSGLHGRSVPDNVRRGCASNLRDSATENKPPRR